MIGEKEYFQKLAPSEDYTFLGVFPGEPIGQKECVIYQHNLNHTWIIFKYDERDTISSVGKKTSRDRDTDKRARGRKTKSHKGDE